MIKKLMKQITDGIAIFTVVRCGMSPAKENPELIRIMRDNRTESLLLRIKWCYQDNGLFYTIRHILLYPFAVFARRKTSTNDNSKDVQVRAPDEALRGVVVESKVQFIGAGSPVPAERSF